MTSNLPLSAYLSQTLIAFTLEFDREFKARCETAGIRMPPPSLAMWANLVRFLNEDGVDERQLISWSGVTRSVIHSMVACLERHGWVTVLLPSRSHEKLIYLTTSGLTCQGMWQTTLDSVEQHWQVKFGERVINTLLRSLEALVRQCDIELPYYPTFSAYASWRNSSGSIKDSFDTAIHLPLFVLLSQALIAFTIEFERKIKCSTPIPESLAMYATVLQFLNEEGLPIRQLPELSGISKSVLNIVVNILEQNSQLVVEQDPSRSRIKLVRLTDCGRKNRDAYEHLLVNIEQCWKVTFGEDTINLLRESLEAIVSQLDSRLPHYPMSMSHRGGTPTGH